MHEYKVKIDGLKKDDVIYLEPISDAGYPNPPKISKEFLKQLEALHVTWGELYKYDKRWNSQ